MPALLLCARDDRRIRYRRRQWRPVLPSAGGRVLVNGTRGNLQVGDLLQGTAGALSVTGCLLFKEWDSQDHCFYYWEEWQLIGASNADTWVEIDHDPGEVLFYEPVRLQETIEPWALTVGQTMPLTISGILHRGMVEEVTTGTLENVIGSPVCPLNIGETMTYAEVRLTDPAGVTSRLTIDSHRFMTSWLTARAPCPLRSRSSSSGGSCATAEPPPEERAATLDVWSSPPSSVSCLLADCSRRAPTPAAPVATPIPPAPRTRAPHGAIVTARSMGAAEAESASRSPHRRRASRHVLSTAGERGWGPQPVCRLPASLLPCSRECGEPVFRQLQDPWR